MLFWVGLWQRKEYRLDRVLVHLRDTPQGRSLLLSPLSFVKWLLIVCYLVFVVSDVPIELFAVLVALLYLYKAIGVLVAFSKHQIRRPVFTAKACFLLLLILATLFGMVLLPVVNQFLWLLVIDRVLPIVVFCFVMLLALPTDIYRDIRIQKAMQKIRKHKNLVVIGVTGSYGKSSTKECIAQVLEQKFSVLKTKESQNTPIGIANTILRGLHKDTQVFVVEMGAYKRGEIAKLCAITKPTIGVLTALNDQHLALFGSFQKIKDTKFELIDSLPHSGTALFNATQPEVYEISKRSKRKHTILYAVGRTSSDVAVLATRVVMTKDKITFDVSMQRKTSRFSAPLIGAHNVENILPAIYIGKMLGMTTEQIRKGIAALRQPTKTMQPKILKNGGTLIDDTFNANPEGISAGLSYLSLYEEKRILVLEPMIELGSGAAKRHEAIGKEIGKTCDVVFLTNGNFAKQIKRGIGGSKCKVYVKDMSKFISIGKKLSDREAILFEGKESAMYLKKLL